jgi:hypothetical protein
MAQNLRAKVFISCGQRKDSEEVLIAEQIADRLGKKGFEPYIAVQQESLRGLKENIFQELSLSEYFLFVDFKREEISDGVHRGSLFCHQELAIASFLDIPFLGFQEQGVSPDDGILKFIQTNCTAFTDRHTLANVIADKIELASWNPRWKNQLRMERDPEQFSEHLQTNGKIGRFFFITVKNLNPYKFARNCYVFPESIYDLGAAKKIPVQIIELKWSGYILPNATIPPSSQRPFDSFFVLQDNPETPCFRIYSDSIHFIPRIKGPGDYLLTYVVISENFSTVRGTFKMHLDNKLDNTRLTESSENPGI